MRTVLTMFFLFQYFLTFAQNGQLKGHVSNIEDSSDFVALNIYLIKDGIEVTSTHTNEKGIFCIKEIPFGTYDLKIYFVGLRDKLIRNILIEDSLKTKNLFFPDNCKIFQTSCPYGHTDNIIPVFYGDADKKTMEKRRKGELIFGDYSKNDCSPNFYCTKHKILF